MYIEIVRTGHATCSAQPSEMQLAGGEPGRVRPPPGTHVGLAADTVRPVGTAHLADADGRVLLVQVDGQTVVEIAGFSDAPGVVLEGGGWMPAARPPSHMAQPSPAQSFFGQFTNDATPMLGGTADAGSLVLIAVGGAVFCVTAGVAGEWALDTRSATPMSGRFDLGADGEKTLLVTSIDATGNSSGIAGVFVLDTVAPPAPELCSRWMDCAAPLFDGLAEPGSRVMLEVGGAVYAVTADTDGCWRLDTAWATPLSGPFDLGHDGPKQVALTSTDAAGNTSCAETSFMLDTRGTPAALDDGHGRGPLMAGVAEVARSVLSAFGGRRTAPVMAQGSQR